VVNKQWHRVDKNLYRSYAVVGFICSLKTEIYFSENISTQEKIIIDKKWQFFEERTRPLI